MNEEEKNNLSGQVPPTTPAEKAQEQVQSARQKALARTRERNAERQFADDDDEALYGAMNDDYDQDQEELGKLRKNRDDLNTFLKTDGRAADMLSRWRRDGSPTPALVREYGKEIVADMTNPEIQDMIETENQEYLKKMAENEELDRQFEENMQATRKMRDALVEEGEFSEDDINAAITRLGEKFASWMAGTIDKKTVVDEIKAEKYDGDTEQARRNGRAQGRNENISKEFDRRAKRGDGVPALASGGGENSAPERSNGALDRASRPSIWD